MNLRLLAAASAALLASAAASAALAAAPQATASDSASINVTVMAPASIAKITDMALGTIVRPAASGTAGSQTATVTLDPTTGSVTTGAGAQHAGTTTAAKFTVTGPAGTAFTASTALGASDTVKNLSGFAIDAASGNAVAIGGGGTSDLLFGAHFTVADNTPTQAYSGTLTVTINYP